ncbi:MAG: F0F1 ATP synthase subunit gamma, partial [Raoultibacter sp.]
MPNLHDIERRIGSVSSTKQITRTMEMVAAAKIRRSNERVAAATPYSTSMVEILAHVAERVGGSENELLQKHDEVKNVLIVAVVSDRGLAGGFNSNVLRYVERLMKEKAAAGAHVSIAACGKKAIGYFNYRQIDPVLEFRDLSADPTVEEATALATYAIAGYKEG